MSSEYGFPHVRSIDVLRIAITALLVFGSPSVAAAEHGWRAAADDIAAAVGMKVMQTGVANLDEGKGPDRWAMLEAVPGPDGEWQSGAAYLLSAGDRLWLVEYENGGRTNAWTPMQRARWLTHFEGHRGGFSEVRFAIRRGRLVILREVELGDAREGDRAVTKRYGTPSASCKACPDLATKHYLHVVGPAESIAELLALAAKCRRS